MSAAEIQYAELVDVLFNAAGEPKQWRAFLECLAESTDSVWAGLISHDPNSGYYELRASFGVPEEALQLYRQYYRGIDPWFSAVRDRTPEGWVGAGTSLVPESTFIETEFYRDYLRKFDAFYQCGAIVCQRGQARAVLALLRSRRQPDFDNEVLQLVRNLTPNIQRALRLHSKMLDLKGVASAAGAVVEALDVALIGVDAEGRVGFMNQLAESLVRAGDILKCEAGRITATEAAEAAALARLLRQAGERKLSTIPLASITLHNGDRSLHVSVLPIPAGNPLVHGPASVLLSILDPEMVPRSRGHLLATLFGLTPAESRVAMLLVGGLTPKLISNRTETTENTVRFQLKSIYRKMGVSGQSQLTRLISRLPGRVSEGVIQ